MGTLARDSEKKKKKMMRVFLLSQKNHEIRELSGGGSDSFLEHSRGKYEMQKKKVLKSQNRRHSFSCCNLKLIAFIRSLMFHDLGIYLYTIQLLDYFIAMMMPQRILKSNRCILEWL